VFIRRAFFYWQFPAAVILPAWILIGWSVFSASGWEILGLIVGVMMLTVAMLATAGLVFARKDVRAERAVSWIDVAFLTVLHGLVIAVGFFTPVTSMLGVLAVIATIALFWSGIVQLVMETRRRVRTAFASYEAQARRVQNRTTSPRIDGEYIVIESTGKPVPPHI
jgi:uncharacterized membrane protein YphA (DoxX/SURF4 family)